MGTTSAQNAWAPTALGGGGVIEGLKPYEHYKPAVIPWFGKVPAHWTEKRAKFLYREVDERSESGREELLSVSHKTGVTPRSQKSVTMFKAESYVGHKLCRPDDLAINTMWAWMGALGVSRDTGIISPAYGVYRPIASDRIHPRFADALLRTPQYVAEYICRSTGIRGSRLRLYPESFLRIPIAFPPLDEQAAIVKFIDHADRRIRRYIRAKQKLIKLIEEQKQAIIHHAVTRGLDANVRVKPSGVEWLGDVPEHWGQHRLKSLATIKTGGADTVDRVDDGAYPFFVRSQTVERIDSWSFDGEAVLTAGDGAGVAKVFHYIDGKFDYHQRVYRFSDFKKVRGRFFFFYFRALLKFETQQGTAKSTVDSLRLPMLQNFPVLVPPDPEQVGIVTHLEQVLEEMEQAVSAAQREVDLLRDYRTRLIADVVTGKLDVREAAAQLPDELDTNEADLDDSDEESDEDDILDEETDE